MADTSIDIQANELGLGAADLTSAEASREDILLEEQEEKAGLGAADLTSAEARKEDVLVKQWEMLSKEKDIPHTKDVSVEPGESDYAQQLENRIRAAQRQVQAERQRGLGVTSEIVEGIDQELVGSTVSKIIGKGPLTIRDIAKKRVISGVDLENLSVQDMLSHSLDLSAKKRRQLIEAGGPDLGLFIKGPPTEEYPRGTIKYNPAWLDKKASLLRQELGEALGTGSMNMLKMLMMAKDFVIDGQWGDEIELWGRQMWNMVPEALMGSQTFLDDETLKKIRAPLFNNDVLPSYAVVDDDGTKRMVGLTEKTDMWLKESGAGPFLRNVTDIIVGDNKVTEDERDLLDHWLAFGIMIGTPLTWFPAGVAAKAAASLARRSHLLEGAFFDLLVNGSKLNIKGMRSQAIKEDFKKAILSGKIKPEVAKGHVFKRGRRTYEYTMVGDDGLKITYTSPLKHADAVKGYYNHQYMNFVLGATTASAVTQSFIQNTMDDWKEYTHVPLLASLVGGFKGIHGVVRGAGKIPGPGYYVTDSIWMGFPTRWTTNYAAFGMYHIVGGMLRVANGRGKLKEWSESPLGKFFLAVSAGAPLAPAINALRKTGMVGSSKELDKLMVDFTMSPKAMKQTNEMFWGTPDDETNLYIEATKKYLEMSQKLMSRVGVEAGAQYGHYMDQVVSIGQLRMYRHKLIRDVKFGTGAFAPKSWIRAMNPLSGTVGPITKQSLLSQLDVMDKFLNNQINVLERDMVKLIKSRGKDDPYVNNVIRAVRRQIIEAKNESVMIQQNWKQYLENAEEGVTNYNKAIIAAWSRTPQEQGGGFLPEFASPTFHSPSVIRRTPEQRKKLKVNNEKNFRREVIKLQNDIHTHSVQTYRKELAKVDQDAPAPVLNMINSMSDEFISSNKVISDIIGPATATPARNRLISEVKRNYLNYRKDPLSNAFVLSQKQVQNKWAIAWRYLDMDKRVGYVDASGNEMTDKTFRIFANQLKEAAEKGEDTRYMLVEELAKIRGVDEYSNRKINDLVRGVMPFGKKHELRTAAWTDIHRPRVQDQKWAKSVGHAKQMDDDIAADVAESAVLMKELGHYPAYIKTQQKKRAVFNKAYEKHAEFWKSAVGAKLLAKSEKQDVGDILDTEDRLINIALSRAIVKEKKHAEVRDPDIPTDISKLKGFKGTPEELEKAAKKEAIEPVSGKLVAIRSWNGLFPKTGTRRIDYDDGTHEIIKNSVTRERAGALLLHSMSMKLAKNVDNNRFLDSLDVEHLDELIEAGVIPNNFKQGENFVQYVITAKAMINPPEMVASFRNLDDTLTSLGKDKFDKIMDSFQLHTIGSPSKKMEKLMEIVLEGEGTSGMFLAKEELSGRPLRAVKDIQKLRKGLPEEGILGHKKLLDDAEGLEGTAKTISQLRVAQQQARELIETPIDILLDTIGKKAGTAGLVQDVKDNLMAYMIKKTIVISNYRSSLSEDTIRGIGNIWPKKLWKSEEVKEYAEQYGRKGVSEMAEKDQIVGLQREINLPEMGRVTLKMMDVLEKIAKKQEEWNVNSKEAEKTKKMIEQLKDMFDWAIASAGKLRMGNLFGRPGDWTPSMITSRAHNFVKGVVAPGYYAIEASFRNMHSAHRDLLKDVVLNPRGVEILYKIQHRTQINRAELKQFISLVTKAVTRGDPNVEINQSLMDATYLYWTGQISPEALRRMGRKKARMYPREKQPAQPQPFVVPSGPGSGSDLSDDEVNTLFN